MTTKKLRLSKNFGFTIIELLLYMGLLAIFLTVLSQIFVASIDVQRESESQSSVQQDGKFILSRLYYDLNSASSIIQPSSAGSSSGVLQFVRSGVTNTYQLSAANLIYNDGSTNYQLNSINTTVSNLSFARRGSAKGKPVISVGFTVTAVTSRAKGTDSATYQETIGTR